MSILDTNHISRGVQSMTTIIRFAVIAIIVAVVGLVIYRVQSGDEEAI